MSDNVRLLFGIERTLFLSNLSETKIYYLRAAGPFSPRLLQRIRPDLMRKYVGLIEEDNLKVISQECYTFIIHLVG